MVCCRVDSSGRRKLVHYFGQKFSQQSRRLGWIDTHLRGQRVNLIRAQTFLNLIAGNGLVFTQADPGSKCAATAAL